MSTSAMRGVVAVAGYPAAAGAQCTDWSAEIQRKRDALRSYLAVLEQARRRLQEIRHDVAGVAAAAAAAADGSSGTAGGAGDDFYPLDDDEPAEEERRRPPMQWQDQVCRQMVYDYNTSRDLPQQHDGGGVGHHRADSDTHDLDLDADDEISRDIVALGLHVPHIQHHQAAGTGTAASAPPPRSVVGGGGGHGTRRRRGFGAVPASAAAIAGLGRHRYDGSSSSSGGGTCVICMKDYKKGRRLRVMPCAYRHRFHGRCIREWLSWSNLCPLCRHALPTAADVEQGGGGGAGGGGRRSTIVRVNVNPY